MVLDKGIPAKYIHVFIALIMLFPTFAGIVTPAEAPDNEEVTSPALENPWPMFRHGITRSGLSTYVTAENRGELLWSYHTGGEIVSSPAIGADGTIYVGSSDNNSYAFNPDGSLKWKALLDGPVRSSPAIGPNGLVFFGAKSLWAITGSGFGLWKVPTSYGIYSSPGITTDGTIYFGDIEGNLYMLGPDGGIEATFRAGMQVCSSPAISSDGFVYFGSYDKIFYALGPTCALAWSYKTDDHIGSSPAIGPDGTVYIGSKDGFLYALQPGGNLKWKASLGGPIFSSPAIGPDGTIYVGSDDCNIYAINPDGRCQWKYLTNGWVDSSPAIGADGTVFIGSDDGNLHCLSPQGTLRWKYSCGSQIFSSPAIGPDGTVYFGCRDGSFYALGSHGRAPSPPRNLRAVTGDGCADLTWEMPSYDGGREIAYFLIYRSDGTSIALLDDVDISCLYYHDGDVSGAANYSYFVTAVNCIGESKPSNIIAITILSRPTPPLKLEATPRDGMVALRWRPPQSDGGSNVTEYCIYSGIRPGSFLPLVLVNASVLKWNDFSVKNEIMVGYYVTAINTLGDLNSVA